MAIIYPHYVVNFETATVKRVNSFKEALKEVIRQAKQAKQKVKLIVVV